MEKGLLIVLFLAIWQFFIVGISLYNNVEKLLILSKLKMSYYMNSSNFRPNGLFMSNYSIISRSVQIGKTMALDYLYFGQN